MQADAKPLPCALQVAKELADVYKSTFLAVREDMACDTEDGKVRGARPAACTSSLLARAAAAAMLLLHCLQADTPASCS